MLRSLYSGVSGLNSHQTKMDVIGNNIANVNTYGYKAKTVAFSDLYYQSTRAAQGGSDIQGGIDPSQIGYGTQVASISKNMARSSFQSSAFTTDIAIAGSGFIQLQDKAGNTFYSRAGNLKIDSDGNLVDSQGKFVLGSVNSTPTNANGLSALAGANKIKINVPDVHKASTAATAVTGTLPTGVTTAPNFQMAFNNGDQAAAVNITVTVGAAGATDGLAYDATTTPPAFAFTLSPESAADIDTVTEMQTKLNELIEIQLKDESSTLSAAGFTGGPLSITMDTSSSGTLTTQQRADIEKLLATQIKGGTTFNLSNITTIPQSKLNLDTITISENGTIIGTHAIHGLLTFGRIDLANFDNPEGLEEAGSSYFKKTSASGEPKSAIPGFDGSGSLVANALEMSNVNLAQEFTDMITAQRGFQANSRIITTSDSLLEELVNLKR